MFLGALFRGLRQAHRDRANRLASRPIASLLVHLTCPIAFFSSYPLALTSVLLANAAMYTLVGLIVETVRRQRRHYKHAN
jgi:hypothetical protein